MKSIRKHRKKILIALLVVLLLTPCVLIYWAGSEIASPPRRQLMGYHREYLDHPSAHGLRIERFTASDGTPCLVCTPEGKPGERGETIRQQMTDRGLTVPPFGEVTGTLVLTHGRRGRKEDYLSIAERFGACGFRCVIPDLPGHGDHPETIATYGIREATLPVRVLYEASRKFKFDPKPAGLMGLSMGGSVAVHAADLPDAPWKALVVVSSFDSFSAAIECQACSRAGNMLGPLWAKAAGEVYHEMTGIRLAEIQPRKHAIWITIPTLIAHGTADHVVPMESGRRLFDSLPAATPKKWLEIPGADHNNVLVTDFPIYAGIAEWMMRNVRNR